MRLLAVLVQFVLVADVAASSHWISNAAYNKWHKNELEQWLSDHDIPYPPPAHRKELQDLVEANWQDYVVQPFHHWDSDQLVHYLQKIGFKSETANDGTNGLVGLIQDAWKGTEDRSESAYLNIKDWILDSWSSSQLKSFCDYYGIPVPQPRERDVLLQKARLAYEKAAKKQHEGMGYPGNWLYDTWTESDFKSWLDQRGIPAPQPSKRDKLIATVRRNSYLAHIEAEKEAFCLQLQRQSALENLQDAVLDTWSGSELKKFCDKNGIKVPQGSKKNEIRALIRKHRAEATQDTIFDRVWGVIGPATTKAGNDYARATDAVNEASHAAFNAAIDKWSESRLKAFLEARAVSVPQKYKIDELRALARENAHQAATGWSTWTFNDLDAEQLRSYLRATGDKAAVHLSEKTNVAWTDLVEAANSLYDSARRAGDEKYEAATTFLASAAKQAKSNTFNTWSESQLKAYLDSYGVPVPQGSTVNELRAHARKQATYFRYGTLSPTETFIAQASEGFKNAAATFWDTVDWALDKANLRVEAAKNGRDPHQKIVGEL